MNFVEIEKRGPVATDVGEGFHGPRWLRVRVNLPEHPDVQITARIEVVAGTYDVTELLVRASAGTVVSAELLRGLPLRTIVRRAVKSTLRSLNIAQVIAPESGERTPEATRLRDVAQLYRLSRLLGDAPTATIAESLGVSRATASRRVAEARRQGFLGDDEIGAGGGARSRLEG